MVTTYRLHVNELSVELLDSIKATFQNKTIEIIVTDAVDETDYILGNEANRNFVLASIKELEEGKGVKMTVEEVLGKYSNKK